MYVVDANDPTIGKYYVNTGATSGNHARGKNIRFPKIIKKDGVDYSSDFTQSDFLGLDAGGDSFAWYCQDTPENFYGFVNLDLSKINTIIVDSDTHEANEFTMSLENNKNVKKLTMFAHVVFIEDSCFKNCALTTITATSGRKYISADHIMNDAFYNCQADVELNGPMIVFGGAFAYTKKIKFNNVAMTIVSDGSDYNGKDVFKNSVTRWSSSTIILSENVGSGCFANATISEGLKEFSMNWSNVITIGAYAFAQSDFTFYSIEITSKMTTISQYAFLEV